jgi:hypothetical protein
VLQCCLLLLFVFTLLNLAVDCVFVFTCDEPNIGEQILQVSIETGWARLDVRHGLET